MLIEVIREIKNCFEIDGEQGTFTIENEILTGFKNKYPIGSYILIERAKPHVSGSIFNSGLYLVNDNLITLKNARNEVWSGTVYLSSPPSDFLALVEKIKTFEETQGTPSLNVSESFGIDSRSRATDSTGALLTWKSVFARQLVPFRNKQVMNINI